MSRNFKKSFSKNAIAVPLQKYKLNIRDTRQPLLISRAKAREIRVGMPEIVCLIPELCRMTGLTDAQRQNFQLMRALADHTRVPPRARVEKLLRFCRRLSTTEKAMQELNRWDLKLADRVVEFAGRAFPPETIVGGGNRSYNAGRQADWTRDLRSTAMFYPAQVHGWVMIVPNRCMRSAENFAHMLSRASQGMQWNLPRPRIHEIRDDRPATYLDALERSISHYRPSLVMCVVTNNKADRYAAIKKKCSVEQAIPSQVSDKIDCCEKLFLIFFSSFMLNSIR